MRALRQKVFAVSLTTALAWLLVCGAFAADYQINWYSINSGGGLVTGGGYNLNSTIGQPAAGFVKNTSYLHWVGFWVGE